MKNNVKRITKMLFILMFLLLMLFLGMGCFFLWYRTFVAGLLSLGVGFIGCGITILLADGVLFGLQSSEIIDCDNDSIPVDIKTDMGIQKCYIQYLKQNTVCIKNLDQTNKVIIMTSCTAVDSEVHLCGLNETNDNVEFVILCASPMKAKAFVMDCPINMIEV